LLPTQSTGRGPRATNIRRVFVDDRGPRPVLWVGSNHGASIVKVEPLD